MRVHEVTRAWYNQANRCPAYPGSIGYLVEPVYSSGRTGFSISNAVRHSSFLAKPTIPMTTNNNSHTAMTVCASMSFSFRMLPRT